MTMGDDDPRGVANLDPQGVANLDPRDIIGRIYVGYLLTLLHTKHTSYRPCCFEDEDFQIFFSIISLWQIPTPPGCGHF